MNIILFGAPGVGKGTQSALLIENQGMVQISTGDLFRSAMENQTELGKKAKSYMDAGDLVPDSIVIGMVDEALDNLDGKRFILDGFPRTTAQAVALDELVVGKNIEINKVISLNVPREELISRLTGRRLCKDCGAVYHVSHKQPKNNGVCDSCGGDLYQRKDDSLDVIENRLATYENNTAPVKDYYQAKGSFVEVDGLGEAEDVYSRIENIIKN